VKCRFTTQLKTRRAYGWLVSAQIGYIVPYAYEVYIVHGQRKTHSNVNKPNERNYTHKKSLQPGLWGGNLTT